MKISQLAMMFLLTMLTAAPTHAMSDDTWDDISDVGVYGLLGTALILPIAKDDKEGAYQSVYSIGSTIAITQLGKALIDAERPDNSDNDSFPSGHTSNAFASATTLHRRYGWQIGFPAYAVATLTGVARERARKHHWYDVLAGAVIGTATGWFFTDAINDKVQLVPWVNSEGGGMTVSMRL